LRSCLCGSLTFDMAYAHAMPQMEVSFPSEEDGSKTGGLFAAKKLHVPSASSGAWTREDATWVEAYRMYSAQQMVFSFMQDVTGPKVANLQPTVGQLPSLPLST
jgi:hypothetical protein